MNARDKDEPTCELLGPVSLLLQLIMGGIAILSLVVKRRYENPRRPWRVWFFDVGKQVLGALMLHFLNLLASILFSDDSSGMDENPCTWYFLNVLFDTTIGVPLLWACLYYVYTVAFKLKMTKIISGRYGDPPEFAAFAKQAALYMIALILAKIFLYLILYTVPFLDNWGAYLISWTNFDLRVQILFVMFIFPCVMNAIQYYLVDTMIQSPEYGFGGELFSANLDRSMSRYGTFEPFKAQTEPH